MYGIFLNFIKKYLQISSLKQNFSLKKRSSTAARIRIKTDSVWQYLRLIQKILGALIRFGVSISECIKSSEFSLSLSQLFFK